MYYTDNISFSTNVPLLVGGFLKFSGGIEVEHSLKMG